MVDSIRIRKKRDTSQKREMILDGAIRVFTEKGFDASSMDQIAEVAGVSKRTVYNHFSSKEVLFKTIVDDFMLPGKKMQPIQYSNSIPLCDQLKAFARAELYLIDNPIRRGLSKLLTSTFLMNKALGDEIRRQHEPHQAFTLWLNAASADHRLTFESAELAAHIFYGLVEGCLTWNALLTDGESLYNVEALLDEISLVFIRRYQC